MALAQGKQAAHRCNSTILYIFNIWQESFKKLLEDHRFLCQKRLLKDTLLLQ